MLPLPFVLPLVQMEPPDVEALQEAVLELPAQVQIHGWPVLVETAEAVPTLHKLVIGGVRPAIIPLAGPHCPLVPLIAALQTWLPALPEQDQVQGPVPLSAEAVPLEHRSVVGSFAKL